MSIVYWGFEVLACVIDSYILMYFIEHFVSENKKSEKIVQGRIIFFIFCTLCGMIAVNDNSFLTECVTAIIFVCYLLYGCLCIDGNKKDIFISASVAYILLGLINMLVPLGVNLLMGIPISSMMEPGKGIIRVIVVLICKIVYYFSIISALHFLKRSSNRLQRREWFIMAGSFIVILMIEIALLVIMRTQLFEERIAIFVLIINLGLFAILVGLYLMLLQLNTVHERQLEYECILLSQKSQRQLLEDREKEFEQLQIIRHDIKNYLSTTLGILQKGNTEEAIEYLNSLLKNKVELILEVVDVGDATINAVINTKFTICREKGISCETAFLGELRYKNPLNLGIIISNLLDNAMEACEKMEDKKPRIVISSANQKGYLDICVKNSIETSVLKINPGLRTTKSEKKLHGYGLKSIKQILEEEEGMMTQYEKNGWFITHIFLPNTNSDVVL
ncbi:sensor histidine kinase [Velocimicrobium porci]|uniref:GHKL domain-containing protein n=1 Tax=Velocimicrobium porci TaxID=2606634 RepID=A0A6L5XZJ0_9FIRM|nr:sensor histidine kinase [Velocimicrobium porci]MSS64134.1 GHKL domain-containing protein [Velocimicrobium porci]